MKYTMYALSVLPTTGIDTKGVYFIPTASGNKFNIFIRKNDNSVWYNLGVTSSVDSVNGASGTVTLDLGFNTTTGVLTLTGSAGSIDLDARYRKKVDVITWAEIDGKPTLALDADVVHKDGAETLTGQKTHTLSPIVPLPSIGGHSANKTYVDSVEFGLQGQINNLTGAITDGMRVPSDIDCSTNPNYPAATKGDGWVVTVAGKIGGASGVSVRVGAEIRCKITNAGGTQAAVGANFYILESDLDQATESVPGFAKIATQLLVNAGTDDTDFVTSKKLAQKIVDNNTSQGTSMDGKYVRYDASQTLTAPQKTQARDNIGAASDTVVAKLGSSNTFTSTNVFNGVVQFKNANPPAIDNAPSSNKHATNKEYVDVTVEDAVKWGGPTGKEW